MKSRNTFFILAVMNIILFGFKSVGKSYFGKLLAKKLNKKFIDLDEVIEKQEGRSCRQIVIESGEKHFRCVEKKAVESIRDAQDTVIALGGGTVLDADNLSVLKKMGKLIYLDLSMEVVRERILVEGGSVVIDKDNFEEMYQQRKVVYESVESCKVELDGKTDEEILDEILGA